MPIRQDHLCLVISWPQRHSLLFFIFAASGLLLVTGHYWLALIPSASKKN
jgi:polyferredoxin